MYFMTKYNKQMKHFALNNFIFVTGEERNITQKITNFSKNG